eukprot:TRINITY_DN16569_c0_g1_i3.p1 TRINITY_DN16569_c0_g1~~TRINITY_DN16569_c0_g1_i3.p1  ORF type:complete len:551 (-),score=69.41 TRINITY_DN16569_c0_g1_i3:166-1818(-)
MAPSLSAEMTAAPPPQHTSEAPSWLAGLDGSELSQLPRELLMGLVTERFLQSPVWHMCQLGSTSPKAKDVFMDEALWRGFFEDRFREASMNPMRRTQQASWSPSARLSYGQLHTVEKNFLEGAYSTRTSLSNPRQGVPVLDLRVAPGATSTSAFAALRDGSIMVYDCDPGHLTPADSVTPCPATPMRACPLQELEPQLGGGPALCCLPLECRQTRPATATESEAAPGAISHGSSGVLVAGYALGRLGAWQLPSGKPFSPSGWETAHSARISALAALGESPGGDGRRPASYAGHHMLLSAGSDALVKAWSLEGERFGERLQTFHGHAGHVVSLAALPQGGPIFLTGSHDRTMRLWDARRGTGQAAEVARWTQRDWVTCVELHPTRDHLAFSSDKSVYQWDLRQPGVAAVAESHRHRKLVSRLRGDPLRLASCSLDGCVKVSSLEEPAVRCISPTPSPRSQREWGRLTATEIWEGGDEVCTLRASADYVLCIDFDASRLFAGSVDGCVDVYDFSDPGHFRNGGSSSPSSPGPRRHCGEPVDIEMTGLQEIEV